MITSACLSICLFIIIQYVGLLKRKGTFYIMVHVSWNISRFQYNFVKMSVARRHLSGLIMGHILTVLTEFSQLFSANICHTSAYILEASDFQHSSPSKASIKNRLILSRSRMTRVTATVLENKSKLHSTHLHSASFSNLF